MKSPDHTHSTSRRAFFFWRQFFPISEPSRLPGEQVPTVDTAALRRAAWRFAEEAQAPLAMKAYLVQYHLRLLEESLDRVLFVHITRDPIAVMSSLLQVRRTLYDDEQRWWGCRPPGIEALTSADPALQVADQVALTDRSIRTELANIPARKQMTVSYEQLCDSPPEVWVALRDKVIVGSADPDAAAARLAVDYAGPASFRRSEKAFADRARLEAAWADMASR